MSMLYIRHFINKVWLNCSLLGGSESLSEMTNVSLSSPGAEDAWVEDTVSELTMEASHEEGEEVTPSPVSLLYTEFRKYVSMDRLSESECLNLGHKAKQLNLS